jgi:hypothetical protein
MQNSIVKDKIFTLIYSLSNIKSLVYINLNINDYLII